MSALIDLQERVAEHLAESRQDETGLQALLITTEKKASVDTQIARRLHQAKNGLLVTTPTFAQSGDLPRGIQVTVTLILSERLPQNQGQTGTRKTATEILEWVYDSLIDWQDEHEGWRPFQFVDASPVEAPEDVMLNVYQITFTTGSVAIA